MSVVMTVHPADSVSLSITTVPAMSMVLSNIQTISKATQSKTATPDNTEQTIIPDEGYTLSSVVINPIPSNYGLITYSGNDIHVS